jgi:hypothetical protein
MPKLIQKTTTPDGVAAENVSAAAGAEATTTEPQSTATTPNKTAVVRKRKVPAPKAYEHIPSFLTKQEADQLYDLLLPLPWFDDEDGSSRIAYGVSYDRGGPARQEIAVVPDFLTSIGDRISAATHTPINFYQLHKFVPEHPVFPHLDPPMTVPMLTVAQERTFRVGGTMHCEKCDRAKMPICTHLFRVKQHNRPLEAHQPEQEILMRHGDLLTFYGAGIIHSMYPASQDQQFNANGSDYRISLLFRYTTPAMRQYGVGVCNKHGHRKQYAEAVKAFRSRRLAKEPGKKS